jgi:hypothetical protein
VLRWLAAACVTAGACAGPKSSAPRPAARERNVLTREEIMSSNAQQGNLYEAIRSLRPQFLLTPPGVHSAGSMSSMPVAVYFGRIRQAGLETLRTIAAVNVEQVTYFDPTASQNEFGPMASGGALVVVLRDPNKLPDTTATLTGAARITVK